ncbi:MAG: hypothetical protein JSS90_09175 [Bacteroidetes bacterium]|jgi:hypothetical protein|nr:hypothetical protein [Bacteroidota bacterium]
MKARTIFTITGCILIVLFNSLPSFSQEESVGDRIMPERKWTITLAGGASLPLGDFADKNTDSYKSGLAMTGAGARLKANFRINRGFFTEANILWFYNPCAADGLLNDLTDLNSPGPRYKVITYPWQVTGVTAGIGTSFDLNEKVLFQLKGMLGIVGGKYSKTIYQSFDGSNTQSITENAETAYSVALNLGFELQYSIVERFGVSFSGDYFNTELKYNNVTLTRSNNTKKDIGAYTQPLSVFQFSLGIFTKF